MKPKYQTVPADAPFTAFAFRAHHIFIASPVKKVLARISQSFGAFETLAPSPATQKDYFEVLPAAVGGYTIRKNGDEIARTPSSRETHRELRHLVIRTFIEGQPDLLWLHAAAAASGGKAVVLAGAYGRGKSTIIAGLCRQGWDYLSDDIVPVDLARGKALPFPLAPNRRLGNGTVLSPKELGRLDRERIKVPLEQVVRRAMPIAALVFPAYEHGAAPSLRPYPPGAATLEMLRRCLNFREHQGEAVSYLSRLVHRFPCFQLLHPGDPEAAQLIIEAFQDRRPAMATAS